MATPKAIPNRPAYRYSQPTLHPGPRSMRTRIPDAEQA
jgi:hypothetical protein